MTTTPEGAGHPAEQRGCAECEQEGGRWFGDGRQGEVEGTTSRPDSAGLGARV